MPGPRDTPATPGDTPFLGQNLLHSVGHASAFVSDLSWRVERGPAGRGGFLTLFVLMSNNGIAAFRSRQVVCFIPVELRVFSARIEGNAVRLFWETEREENNLGFSVERRFVGDAAFAPIGFVPGYGSTSDTRTYTHADAITARHRSSRHVEYRLQQFDTDGSSEYSPIVEIRFDRQSDPTLEQNHPNPFNPSTSITYSLPEASRAVLTLHNTAGQQVRTLIDAELHADTYSVTLDATALPSGHYTYRLSACGRTLQRCLTIVR